MSIADLARRVGKLAIDHSPTILTSVGVVGTITTAYLAGKASFSAARVIEKYDATAYPPDFPDDRTSREAMKDRVRLVWKLYIPAGTVGVATIVCIIGANHIGGRRAAGLAAATTIIERSFDEYKAKVAEKFGERKEEQVRDEVIHDRIQSSYNDNVKMFGITEGKVCYDAYSGNYFLGSVEGINAAVNVLNNAINHDGYASLADFYRLLEMETPGHSENTGWNSDKLLEVRTGADLAHESFPIITMEFRNDPSPDYGRFRRY